MKIKKVDDRPMVIHTKEKTKLHTKGVPQTKLKGRSVLMVNRSPVFICKRHQPKLVISKCKSGKSVAKADDSHEKQSRCKNAKETVKQEVKKEANLYQQYHIAKKDCEAAIKKKSGAIRLAESIGIKVAAEQMEGGSEVLDACQFAYAITRPAVNATNAGRTLYRNAAAKQNAEKRIKKVQTAKNRVQHTIGKKAGQSVKKTTQETIKGAAKKTVKETTKTAARVSATAAATAAGTAVTGPGGILIGAAAGEAAGIFMDKKDLKRSTRNRMLQLFLAKMGQEENQDSIAKTLKDIAMMKFALLAKYVVRYVGMFLAGLLALAAIVALPVVVMLLVIYNSPFAIFFPSISSGESVQQVLSEYVSDFNGKVSTELMNYSGYDGSEKVYLDYEGAGEPDNYYDILAVYMVRYGIGDTATDMTDIAKENLKDIFDNMCSYSISTRTETSENEEDNTTTYKQVNVKLKTCREMIPIYTFGTEEQGLLTEFMNPEYLAMLGYTGSGGGNSGESIDPRQYQAIVDAVSDENGKKVVAFVLSKVGYPYSQDYRDSGNYYDCSSLAYYAWQNAGISILYEGANTAAAEGKYCYDNNLLVAYEEMQPGDLIFYSYSNNGRFMNITHVAVYVGNGKVVEAANERIGVVYRDVQSRGSIVFIGRPR